MLHLGGLLLQGSVGPGCREGSQADSLLWLQAVAHTSYRLDDARVERFLELLAKVAYIDVDDVGDAVIVLSLIHI